jgi:GDP-L-fucose synthase
VPKILLTGARGFLGRHTLPVLQERYGRDSVIGVSSADYDLMDRGAADQMLDDVRPDVLVHFAAYSGGIGANRAYPADFYYRNTILTANVFDSAARHRLSKLVYPMGGCSYPAAATSPIDETQLFQGYPQEESASYSTAKMMGLVAARSYRKQYGLSAAVIIPGNMYGEYDNFALLDSHVVPAMIRRYYEARLSGARSVEMWGTGTPSRDFVYAGDVARCIPTFIDTFDEVGPVNVSTGMATTIKELAEMIARVTGFDGEIRWDKSKPDGQMVKVFATGRLKALGLSCDTPLSAGLRKTADWLIRNYAARSDGLRL